MARFDSIKQTIDSNIKSNGNQEITGQKLNAVLNGMMTSVDAALTDVENTIPEAGEGAGNSVEAAFLEFNDDGSALTAEQKAHNAEIYRKILNNETVQVYLTEGRFIQLQPSYLSGTDLILDTSAIVTADSDLLMYQSIKLSSDGDIQPYEYKEYPLGGSSSGSPITVDTILNVESTNPVTNAAIKTKFNEVDRTNTLLINRITAAENDIQTLKDTGGEAGSASGSSARELYVDFTGQGLTDEQKAYNVETINLIDEGKVPNVFVSENNKNIPLTFDYTSYSGGKGYIFLFISTFGSEYPGISGAINTVTILSTGDAVPNQEYILGAGPNDTAFPISYTEIDRSSIETLTRNDLQEAFVLIVRGQPSIVLYLSQAWTTMIYRSSLIIEDAVRWCIKELEVGESGSVYRTIYLDINEVDNTSN